MLSYKRISKKAKVSLLPRTHNPLFLEHEEQSLTLRKAVIANLGSEYGNEHIFLTATG